MIKLPRVSLAVFLLAACAAVAPATAAASTTAPTSSVTGWLAGQIGPVRTTGAAPAGVMRMRGAGDGAAASITSAGTTHPLRLVRSFQIPADDPSAARLAN